MLSGFLLLLFALCIHAIPLKSDQNLFARSQAWDSKSNPYPAARRDDVSFSYASAAANGNVTIADPYNYLEQSPDSSKEVQTFIDLQFDYFKKYVQNNLQDLSIIRASIKDAGKYNELQFPEAFGNAENPLYTFYHREAGSDSKTFYIATQAEIYQALKTNFSPIPGKAVLDETTLGENKYAYFVNISPDGKKFLYRTRDKTNNFSGIIYIRDISTIFTNSQPLKDYPEVIKGNSDTSDGWTLDSDGFFYLHNDVDNSDGTDTLLYHKLNTPVENDIVIIKADKTASESFSFQLSNDKNFIILYIYSGKSGVYAAPLNQAISTSMKWVLIAPEEEELKYVTNLENEFYFVVQYDDQSNQVVKYVVDPTKASQIGNLKDLKDKAQMQPTVIPEDKSALIEQFTVLDTDKILLAYTQDAKKQYFIYDLKTGKQLQHVLPDFFGSAGAITSLSTGTDAFLWSWTFNCPNILYHIKWDKEKETATDNIVFQSKVQSIDLSKFIVELNWAISKDSTRIPFHIFYRKGIKFDGTKAVMINFFGAFRVIWLPYYDATYMSWVNAYDAIFVEPYPRGGGEVKGEEWHQAGMLGKKQNTLDDVNAVIQYLIDNKIAGKGKIVLYGQFSGSTSTVAIVNQAPEGNIGAVILSDAIYGLYGEYDLLRFETSPGTSEDVAEYGDPHDSKAFDWLRKISPLHNVDKTKLYPAILFLPGNDSTSNWHGRKMVAELQYDLPNNPNPFLFNPPGQATARVEDIHSVATLTIAFASHVLDLKRVT